MQGFNVSAHAGTVQALCRMRQRENSSRLDQGSDFFLSFRSNMKGAEILTTIAQLAVGVTGFSGIVIAFNRAPGRLNKFEAFRIQILFMNSLAAMFLSLLPFAFYYLNWSDTIIWQTGSGLIAIFEFVFLAIFLSSARRFWRPYREVFNVAIFIFFATVHTLNALLQLLGVFGWNAGRGLSIFLLGLLWLLFHSAFQFGRILFVQPMERS
jgi:hypothetical protein